MAMQLKRAILIVEDSEELSEAVARTLLDSESRTILKDQLQIADSNFIERVWAQSEKAEPQEIMFPDRKTLRRCAEWRYHKEKVCFFFEVGLLSCTCICLCVVCVIVLFNKSGGLLKLGAITALGGVFKTVMQHMSKGS
jgi:hypothetical protein